MRPLAVLAVAAACQPAPAEVSPGTPAVDPDVPPTATSDVPQAPAVRILINEICASNRAGPTDEAGGHPDWIELYNPNPVDFPLAGLTLTDDGDEPAKHPLDPSLVVPAGGWLVLYADGAPDQGPAHLGFQLDADGEEVELYAGDTRLARVRFGPLLPDTALARAEDGGPDFVVTATPTPGAANGTPAAELGPANAEPPEACQPAVSVPAPWPLEGDAVELTAACTTGAALPPATLLATRPGPTLTGDRIAWTPGPADAGPNDVLVVLAGPGVPETARAGVSVVDDWRNPDNVPADPTIYVDELGLPVLHLDPAGALSEDYVPADAWFDGEPYTATVKIRGAASADYAKPSLTVEFEPEQLDLDAVGLGRKDHLVLISNFDDGAYVRQKLVYDTWAEMAARSGEARILPRTAFVVVYLDGAYQGLFTAVDHVDDELVEEMGFDPSGNLYKSVSHDANFMLTNAAGQPKATLHDGWEKKEGLPDDDFADLDALVAFTGAADPATFDAEADAWLSRAEFMDWFALVHWFAADDSGGKNAYLYADPADGRFRYVPWDFNHALGQNWYTARVPSDAYNDFVWTNRVFWQFLDDPDLAQILWSRFADHRAPGNPLDAAVLRARVDAYYAQIAPSAARDWDRWADAHWERFGWARSDRNGFVEERAYLEQWIAERGGW